MFFNLRQQQGQVLLVVVLVMVVSLTLGLSVASKSITSFKTSTEEAESQKALHAAEAGIERVIQSQEQSLQNISLEKSSYSTSVADTNLSSLLLNAGNPVAKDEGIDLWLANYPDYSQPQTPITSFIVYWGAKETACDNPTSPEPALEIAVISGTKASPVLTKYAYDPCETRRSLNKLWPPNIGTTEVSGISFKYNATVNIPAGNGLLTKIIPLYASGVIAVRSSPGTLPSQGKIITSTGISGSSQRSIKVFQGHPETPGEFFPYNLFSP